MTENRYSGLLDSTAILRFSPEWRQAFWNSTTDCQTALFPFRSHCTFADVTGNLALASCGCLLSPHADCASHDVCRPGCCACSSCMVLRLRRASHESPCHRVREVDFGAVVSGFGDGRQAAIPEDSRAGGGWARQRVRAGCPARSDGPAVCGAARVSGE